MSKLSKYLNTVKYMKPEQFAARVAHAVRGSGSVPESAAYKKICGVSLLIPELDCDEGYVSRFCPEKLLSGELTLLNTALKADYSSELRNKISPLLFYNVHYFEYAVALGAMHKKTADVRYYEAFERLYTRYLSERKKLYPYVVSLHIPNILIALELFGEAVSGEFREKIYKEIYIQYRFLLDNRETHLLGNHYFENLKAIIIASRFFGEEDVTKKHLVKFFKQIRAQILPDGMHEELSLMYHRIILEDILRVYKAIAPDMKKEAEMLADTVRNMLSCSEALSKGMGKTPFFNDSADGVAKEQTCLAAACKSVCGCCPEIEDAFENAGYYKLYDGDAALMFDAGRIGPDYNPGHGQCDCLSFELSYKNKPVFVNSGTYRYQSERRPYFRSTKAHNTAMLEGREQSECWQEHRVAGRISDVSCELVQNGYIGSYKSCHGDLHTRRIMLAENKLTVLDSFKTGSAKIAHSYLHIAPGYSAEEADGEIIIKKDSFECSLKALGCGYTIHRDGELCDYSPEFNLLEKGICIEFIWNSDMFIHGYEVEFKA